MTKPKTDSLKAALKALRNQAHNPYPTAPPLSLYIDPSIEDSLEARYGVNNKDCPNIPDSTVSDSVNDITSSIPISIDKKSSYKSRTSKTSKKQKSSKPKPSPKNTITLITDSTHHDNTSNIPPNTKPPKNAVASRKGPLPSPPSKDELPDNKEEMTERELKFLDIYFSNPGIHKTVAVQRAGFTAKNASAKCYIADRIIEKFETRSQGPEILRRIGLGESKIAQKLLDMIDHPDPKVALQAIAIASKCLGLQRETIDQNVGVEIVIRSEGPPPELPGGDRPGQPGLPAPPKPVALLT